MLDAPVQATIRTDCLRYNVRTLREHARPASLMAVLKADAYGHGVQRIAPLLQAEGIAAFAVARLQEAIALRRLGISGSILVLAPPTLEEVPAYAAHALHASVTSADVARMLIAASPSAPVSVHVNVDTGMHRLGLASDAVPAWWQRLHAAASVNAEGLYTHLATADAPAHPRNDVQLSRFASVLRAVQPAPAVVHVANTDALTHLPDRLPPDLQFVRAGLGLYGLTSVPPRNNASTGERRAVQELKPVLSLQARVMHTHTVPAGETVSYGAHWTAPHDVRVATLSIGYGDGYPRAASGAAQVRIHGMLRPIVGRICMDLCMVDLGSPTGSLAQRTTVGDTAVLFDERGPTLHDVAQWSGTIPYEVACQLAPRVPRRYCDRPETASVNNGTI